VYCIIAVMARQAGDIMMTGTIDGLCFYKMCGRYYVRMKSSLSGKRFWRDQVFEGSRKSCSRFGRANQIASAVFKLVEKNRITNRLFPFLRTRAIALIKEGRGEEEVVEQLMDYLVDFGFIEEDACTGCGTGLAYDGYRQVLGEGVVRAIFLEEVLREAPA
jgi:hypothetical protein